MTSTIPIQGQQDSQGEKPAVRLQDGHEQRHNENRYGDYGLQRNQRGAKRWPRAVRFPRQLPSCPRLVDHRVLKRNSECKGEVHNRKGAGLARLQHQEHQHSDKRPKMRPEIADDASRMKDMTYSPSSQQSRLSRG